MLQTVSLKFSKLENPGLFWRNQHNTNYEYFTDLDVPFLKYKYSTEALLAFITVVDKIILMDKIYYGSHPAKEMWGWGGEWRLSSIRWRDFMVMHDVTFYIVHIMSHNKSSIIIIFYYLHLSVCHVLKCCHVKVTFKSFLLTLLFFSDYNL